MFKNLLPWKKKKDNVTVRHEPTRSAYSPAPRFHDEFDSVINRYFGDRWFGSDLARGWDGGFFSRDWDLRWEDNGSEYVVHVELPGFASDELDLKVSGTMLTVSAAHRDEKKSKKQSQYHFGSYSTRFALPDGVDENNVEAHYKSGVLEIRVPKKDVSLGKRIEVRTG